VALPWIRLDTQFPTNPKVLTLVEGKKFRAAFVYCCSLSYSGAHGTAGYIPKSALPFIHATPKEALDLALLGLWKPAVGGWDINDWDEYQESSEAAVKRRERARKGACAKNHQQPCDCWRAAA
jgi:hypothetical protein